MTRSGRDFRPVSGKVATGALVVALLALLLLPLVHEGGVLRCPVTPVSGNGSPIQTTASCVLTRQTGVIPGAILIARMNLVGFGSSERGEEGVVLWLDVVVVVVALVVALALSFRKSRPANVGRVIATGLAAVALVRFPLTPFPASTALHYYEGRNPGWEVALAATLVALIAEIVAVEPSQPDRTP